MRTRDFGSFKTNSHNGNQAVARSDGQTSHGLEERNFKQFFQHIAVITSLSFPVAYTNILNVATKFDLH
jgi:hypothetical protein